MSTGRLIVLEGPDGAGKSTTSRYLAERLRTAGTSVSCFAFPGNELRSLGKHVYELHHDPSSHGIDRIHETALQVLHAAAHIDALSTRIRPAIERGDTVIMDRFWWSTVVYGRVTGVDAVTIGLLQQLAEHHWNFVVPTAAYLLMGVTECPPNVQSQPDQLRHAYADFVAGLEVPFPVRVLYASGTNGNFADQILQDIGTHGRPSPA